MAVTQTDTVTFLGGTVPNPTIFESTVTFEVPVSLGNVTVVNAVLSGYLTVASYTTIAGVLTVNSNSIINYTGTTSSTSSLLVQNQILPASSTSAYVGKFYTPNYVSANYTGISLGISDSDSACIAYSRDNVISAMRFCVDNASPLAPTVDYCYIDSTGTFYSYNQIIARKGFLSSGGTSGFTNSGNVLNLINTESTTDRIMSNMFTALLGSSNYTSIRLGIASATCMALQYVNSATPYTYISTNQNTTSAPTNYIRVDNSGNFTATGSITSTSYVANANLAASPVISVINSVAATNKGIESSYSQPNMQSGDYCDRTMGIDTISRFAFDRFTTNASSATDTYGFYINGANFLNSTTTTTILPLATIVAGSLTGNAGLFSNNAQSIFNYTAPASTSAFKVNNNIAAGTSNRIVEFYMPNLDTVTYSGMKLGKAAATCTSLQYINSATPLTYISTAQNTDGLPTNYMSLDNSGNGVFTGNITAVNGVFTGPVTVTSSGTTIGGTFKSTNSRAAGTSYLQAAFFQTNMNSTDLMGICLGKAASTSTQIQYMNSATPITYISSAQNTVNAPTNYISVDSNGNFNATGTINSTGAFSVATNKFTVATDGSIGMTSAVGGTGTSSSPAIATYFNNSWTPTFTQTAGTTVTSLTVNRADWEREGNGVKYYIKFTIVVPLIAVAETQTFTISIPFSTTFSSVNKGNGLFGIDPTSGAYADGGWTGAVSTTSGSNTLTFSYRIPVSVTGTLKLNLNGFYEVN